MSALLDKLRAQREGAAEVAPGKVLTVRRPLAAHMPELRAGITPELVIRHVTAWSGVTEADLLGAAVGASDPVPFSPELMAEVVLDRPEWLDAVSLKLLSMVNAYFETRGATAKNSQPSSNPEPESSTRANPGQ